MYNVKRFSKDIATKDFIENYVNIEKFLEYCKQCPSYNNNYACPPFDFDPMEIWNSYENFKVLAFQINLSEETLKKSYSQEEQAAFYESLIDEKIKLLNQLLSLERRYPNSLALSMGKCDLCVKCEKLCGESCKNPYSRRNSIESLGGDVDSFIEEVLGFEVLWPEADKLPKYTFLVGGLLY